VGGADVKVRDLVPFSDLKNRGKLPDVRNDTTAVLPNLNPALASKLIDAIAKTEAVNPDEQRFFKLDRPAGIVRYFDQTPAPDFSGMAPGMYDPNDRQALRILLQAGGKPSQPINLDPPNDFGNSPAKVYASSNPLLIAAALGIPADAPGMSDIIQQNAEVPAGNKATDEQVFYTLAKYGLDPKTYAESGFDPNAMNAQRQTGLLQALAETAQVKHFNTPITTPESSDNFKAYADLNKKDATGKSGYDYVRMIYDNLQVPCREEAMCGYTTVAEPDLVFAGNRTRQAPAPRTDRPRSLQPQV
jgi:hypothetical protein